MLVSATKTIDRIVAVNVNHGPRAVGHLCGHIGEISCNFGVAFHDASFRLPVVVR